jgi:hypothetical protein
MRRLFVVIVLLGGLGLGTLAWNAGQADARPKRERHPEIRRALGKLRGARSDLRKAARDFRGHRTRAIRHIDQAIRELNLALKVDRK